MYNTSTYLKMLPITLVILLLSVQVTVSEIYSSMAHIKDELDKRRLDTSISELKQLIDSQEQRLLSIKRIVQTLDDLGSDARDPVFTVHHPLDAYRFIKNHSTIYNGTVTYLKAELQQYKEEQEKMDIITNNLTPIPVQDLLGTLEGILRIQYVYDLKTKDIADGNIRNFTTRKMSAAECKDVMTVAYTMELTDFAREWINTALERVTEGDSTSSFGKILTKAAAVAFQKDDRSEAFLIYEVLYNLNPKNRYHRHKLKYYERNSPPRTMVVDPYMHHRICKTCQGIKLKKYSSRNRRLFCRYLDNGNPILRYQPAKFEVISLDPYIAVYHDCFSKTLLSKMKKAASPFLKRSKTTDGSAKAKGRIDQGRTSKGMTFDMTERVVDIYRYVEALTSLKLLNWELSFEKLAVANYGVGGHYKFHSDHVPGVETENDRIATFMIYLSDVEEGGATAFPFIGEQVYPEEGKALFWYNLYPNGKGNSRTSHTACPVIIGDKWVANIWIRSFENEFTRPCNLGEHDTKWKI